MKITFRIHQLAQSTPDQIELALNKFEIKLKKKLPEDYRAHMLIYNGGMVEQDDIEHKDYTEDGGGIAKFNPIGIGSYTIEEIYNVMTENRMLLSGLYLLAKQQVEEKL